MVSTGRLMGKACLITGAASGIGRMTALRFAEEGARVAVADVRGDAAEATARELGGAAFGTLDVVVNNAGVTIVGAVHELAESDWDGELDTDLKSVHLVSKAAWPL